MGLTAYRKKRNFSRSPEPQGGKPAANTLAFVVQKHAASHLHYDFRLELGGVLKSWAVPKGPSLDPSVKRLAMLVEDHPFDYRNFEGVIPSGYGAGTVIVWDQGWYEPEVSGKTKKEQERSLRKQFFSGKLKIILHGEKLKGEFALVKAPARGENAWLLMKTKDRFVSEKDILHLDKSVISGQNLDEVANHPAATWESHRPSARKEKPDNPTKNVNAADGKKTRFSLKYRPMLATLSSEAPEGDDWISEVKWDGYRALAFKNKSRVELRSRNDKSFNDKFYPVTTAVKALTSDVVLDGEIVVVNDSGVADFSALQNWRSEADGDILYYVFDILWLDGRELTGLPLLRRKEILRSIIPEEGIIRVSEIFDDPVKDFFEAARRMNLEGIVVKNAQSEYYPGARSREWLKLKAAKRQEVVIGGYTINENSGKRFSSVLVGVYENGALHYVGKVGTGFNQKTQAELMKKFKPLQTKQSPFVFEPDINKPSRFRPQPPKAKATWLKPELVCEVNYAELTPDGIMRHPSFAGLRVDKNPKDIHLELPMPLRGFGKDSGVIKKSKKKAERKTLLNPTEQTQVKKVNGHALKFNNLNKIFWPKEKVTKRDLINYYYQIAPYMLPYLKGRPQSMNRFPNGIYGKSFYQKDVTGKAPAWVDTFPYHSEADNRDKQFLVCSNEASLLYIVSLGCIEINPWSSTVKKPDHPDWCVIDLDPGKTTFEQVIEAAQVTKEVLDALGVPGYPKTSGSQGIHIYIPLGAKYDYEQSKEFARIIATLVHRRIPDFTSIERVVKNRKGKMYIDFLQNRPQATLAAPYSLRPKPGATVSMPLRWEEVRPGLKLTDFTIFNAVERVRETGDLFKPVLGKGLNLKKTLKKIKDAENH